MSSSESSWLKVADPGAEFAGHMGRTLPMSTVGKVLRRELRA